MVSVPTAGKTQSGFPFNFLEDEYAGEQRFRDSSDLLAEVSAGRALLDSLQYLALEHAEAGDGTFDYVARQLPLQLAELERRQRLLEAHRDHPFRPRWPKLDNGFQDRIVAVRTAWPIERFCRHLLCMELIPAGAGKYKARCPLPGHDDTTPSFSIDTTKNLAYCHGCNRGGDVLKLTQYFFNLDHFTAALKKLERTGGVR